MRWSWLAMVILPGMVQDLAAQSFRAGLDVFALADGGRDIQVSFRAEQSPWEWGYRWVQWTDTFKDPFTDRALTKTTGSKHGPLVYYHFRPLNPRSWYLGGAVYRWSKRERALMTEGPTQHRINQS